MGCYIVALMAFVVALLFGAVIATLSYYLGWYALLAVPLLVVVVALVLYFLARRFGWRLLLIPFLMKGRVLKGARIDVHEAKYLGREDSKADRNNREKWYAYLVDLTITPSGRAATPFQLWDPYELMPVPPDAKVSYDEDPTDGSFGSLAEIAVYSEGQWVTEDFDKLHGASRIRVKIRLAKPSAACKLRYYFYDIGRLELPPIVETA